ncbi:MAG: YgjP-like metallopeptidase domain-containing protein, partial [Pseudomonadota bacterium]
MAETLTVGTPPIAVALRRSARARRMTLRVSAVDGGAVLTVPKRVGARLISEFLEERSDWLRAAQARTPQPVAVAPGAVLPIEGVARQVRATSGRQVVLTDGAVQVPGAAGAVGPRLLGWIKQVARDRVVTAADHHAARLGRRPGRFTMRDTRSRWGSCTSEGHIM